MIKNPSLTIDRISALIILFIGIVGFFLATTKYNGKGSGFAFTLIVTGLTYPYLRKHIITGINKSVNRSINRHKYIDLVLIAILMLYFIISCVQLINSEKRPLWWFFATPIMMAATGLMVGKIHKKTFMICVLILATTLILPFAMLYPELGSDQVYHRYFTSLILEKGQIPQSEDPYKSFPFMHIGIATLALVTGISEFSVVNIVYVALPFASVFLLLLYLILKKTFNHVIASYSAYLVLFYAGYTYWGAFALPMTCSLVIFLITLFATLILLHRPSAIKGSLLLMIIIPTLVFTHPLTSLVLVMFYAIIILQDRLRGALKYKNESYKAIPRSIKYFLLMASILMLVNWTYVSHFLEKRIIALYTSIENRGLGLLVLGGARDAITFELDNIGFNILIYFSMLGILYYVAELRSNKVHRAHAEYTFSILLGGITCLAIALGSWIFGITELQSDRWFFFSIILLVPFAAFSMLTLFSRRRAKVAMFLILTIMGTTSIMSTMVNPDSPFYGSQVTLRLRLNSREYACDMFVIEYVSQQRCVIYADFLIVTHLVYTGRLNSSMVRLLSKDIGNKIASDTYLYNGVVRTYDSLAVIRQYLFERPVERPDYIYSEEDISIIMGNLSQLGTSRIYDNYECKIYFKDNFRQDLP